MLVFFFQSKHISINISKLNFMNNFLFKFNLFLKSVRLRVPIKITEDNKSLSKGVFHMFVYHMLIIFVWNRQFFRLVGLLQLCRDSMAASVKIFELKHKNVSALAVSLKVYKLFFFSSLLSNMMQKFCSVYVQIFSTSQIPDKGTVRIGL